MGSFALRMVALEEALGDLRVTVAPPRGRTAFTPSNEPTAQPVDRDHSSSWTAYLSYVDADGKPSERPFTCHAIVGFEGATHVTGFCHKRRASRTLRVDRIRELACAETGEIFDAAERFDFLRASGALRCEDKVMTDVARMLVFLARCDGDFHPLEEVGLEEQIHRYCRYFNATAIMAEDVMADCKRLAPDSTDMLTAMRRIAKAECGPRVARFVLDAGAAIIDADGQHADQETRWAVEMSSALKAVSDGRMGH